MLLLRRVRMLHVFRILFALLFSTIVVSYLVHIVSNYFAKPIINPVSEWEVLRRAEELLKHSKSKPLGDDDDFGLNRSVNWIPVEQNGLIRFIWERKLIIYRPWNQYHLENPHIRDPFHDGLSEKIFQIFFGDKIDGVFVDYQAGDGETGSKSLFLEWHMGWRGLLIEPNPSTFQKLLEKNRKVWMSNICIAAKDHPYWAVVHNGILVHKDDADIGMDLETQGENETRKEDEIHRIPCLPLYSMLVALEYKEIDIFFLDVENDAMRILKWFPFHRMTIKVIVVKILGRVKSHLIPNLEAYMKSQGYKRGLTVEQDEPRRLDIIVFSKK